MNRETKSVVAVTGATGAIGEAIARQLAESPDHEVVLVCRDEAKARATADRIRARTGNPNVRVALADLSRAESVASLAAAWDGPLHVLVNNAAVAPPRRRETPEGIELVLATNVLGYLWATLELEPILRRSAPARVINVASYWAGGLMLDDLEFRSRRYDNDAAYRQSKQANRMLTVALAERLDGSGVVVNACHPGDVRSRLSSDLGFGGHESADQAARTPVWLATDDVGAATTGGYFEHGRRSQCRFAQDREAVSALWERCCGYVP